MEHYRRTSHTRFDIKLHFVWITKCQKRLLVGAFGHRARGFFVASSGNETDEVIRRYIETQDQDKNDDDF